MAGYSPDLITVPCAAAFPEPRVVGQLLSGADALILGCGVVRTNAAHKALLAIVQDCNCPILADAEALHAVALKPDVCKGKRILLTPNAGEFQVLSKRPWPSSEQERTIAVRQLAKHYHGTRVHVDHEGSPYLTKGGYGDLLAGVAGALLARGQSPFEAAKAAAYLVGRAGRMASARLRESTLASDALAQLPNVLNQGRN